MALYMTFLYRHFPSRGACAFGPTIPLVEGVCCTVGRCDFFVDFFFIIWDMLLVQL